MQDIVTGDVMMEGGRVYQTIIGDGTTVDWYSVDGVIVTGEHVIFDNNRWQRVKDGGYPLVPGADQYYVVANEKHRMLAKNGQLFTDFQEVDYHHTGWENWSVDRLNRRVTDSDMHKAIQDIKQQ